MITSLATHSKATRSDFNAGKELQFDWNFFNQNLHLITGLPVVCITHNLQSHFPFRIQEHQLHGLIAIPEWSLCALLNVPIQVLCFCKHK